MPYYSIQLTVLDSRLQQEIQKIKPRTGKLKSRQLEEQQELTQYQKLQRWQQKQRSGKTLADESPSKH